MRVSTFSLLLAFLVTGISRAVCQETTLSVTQANEAYANHEYVKAASLFEKIARYRYRVPVDLPNKLADCYRQLHDYSNEALWYKKVTDRPLATGSDWVNYGDALKSLGMYTQAKDAYHHAPDSLYAHIMNRVIGCDSAQAWIASPTNYTLYNLSSVNTTHSDWGAVWYPPYNGNAGSLVFTSDSIRLDSVSKDDPIAPLVDKRTGRPFQKTYAMDEGALGSDAITGFSPVINENIYHDGAVAFSHSGDTAYFTVTNPGSMKGADHKIKTKEGAKTVVSDLRRLELFWTVKDSTGHWGPSHAFAYNNSQYSVGQATLNKEGNILYFASDMPGGFGQTDIWYSEKQADGSWSAPVNCGPSINTESEEAFPNIGPDGSFYFSSKGHIGMGGFDLFRATGERSVFNDIINLQYPLNSPGDDFYLTMKDSLSGYLSSDRQGGKGSDDIYAFSKPDSIPDLAVTLVPPAMIIARTNDVPLFWPFVPIVPDALLVDNDPDVPDALKKGGKGHKHLPLIPISKVVVLKTLVVDWLSGEPLEGATVMVAIDKQGVSSTTTTPDNGLAFQTLDSITPLTDSAFKDGYKQDVHVLKGPVTKQTDTLSIVLRLLKNPETGDLFVLRRLYFDFDKWNIRPDAAVELTRLITYMRQFPSMTIDMSAHTDSRGDDDYNQVLSEKRAMSARSYMVNHGIAIHRVITHGYGESMLTNGCANDVPCSEAQHQANRRVEVKILHP